MTNTLLRSGDIKDFQMLGQDGKAAFLVATQIRETFRVKLGKEYADYLAIPQRNDQGNIIDWYIPFQSDAPDGEYDIVPWSSANEEEQDSARNLLNDFEQKVIELGKKLASNSKLEGDQLLFSRLIYDPAQNPTNDKQNLVAIRFPSAEYVYIVNGKPVITFWGFVTPQTKQTGSPFYCLDAIKTAPLQIPIVPTHPIEVLPWWKRWRFWLLALLPLLLLALISLLLLRSCTKPEIALPSADLKAEATVPFGKDKEEEKHDEIQDPKQEPKQVDVIKDHDVVGGNGINGVNGAVNGVDPNNPSVPVDDKDKSLDAKGIDNDNNNMDNNKINNDDKKDNDKQNNDPTQDPKNNDKNDNEQKGDDKQEPNKQDNNQKDNDQKDNDQKESDQNGNKNNDTLTQDKKLALPPQVMQQGSTQFLDGSWSVGGGIQDKATGKPLRLQYDFNKGNGEVTVTRSDGVKCVGNVGSNIAQSNLNITSNTEAQCSDNSKYQLPKIQCVAGQNNEADCQGFYQNGEKFPITMKQQ